MTYEDDAAHDERPAAGIAAAGASRAGEQRLQREFGRVPNGLVMISLDTGRPNPCLAVNDAYCELTGYSPRELDGRDFLGDIHPEDQPALETLIQDVRSGAVSLIRADARLVRKDGEIVYGRLTGSVIGPPTGERYLATFIEDTSAAERTRAEIRRLPARAAAVAPPREPGAACRRNLARLQQHAHGDRQLREPDPR